MKKLLLFLLVIPFLLNSCFLFDKKEREAEMRARLEARLKDSLSQVNQAVTSPRSSSDVRTETATEGRGLKKATRTIDYGSNSHAKIESFKEIISTRRLTEEDIAGLNDDELSLLNNLVYAIHGYRFTQQRYLEFFSYYDWYNPTTTKVKATRIEEENAKFIRKHMD